MDRGLPPVEQVFTLNAVQFLAGIHEMITETDRLADSIDRVRDKTLKEGAALGHLRDEAIAASVAEKKLGDSAAGSVSKVNDEVDRLAKKAEQNSSNGGLLGKILTGAQSAQKKGGPAWLGPALLAAPVVTSLLGVTAGAAIGLGGAFATAGVAAAAYGMVAKSVLSQADTAAQKVQKAQDNYNIAIANGTKQATAYKAEQVAIGKAYAEMSPAQIQLSKQLGDMSNKWQDFKASVTPMIAGSLQPWLTGITTAVGSLKSLLTPMAPVVHDLGVQFATLMTSSTFRDFMAWTGKTGAGAAKSLGNAALDLLTGLTFILPQFTPLMTGASGAISKWGDAFVRWSASQKAANEIHNFLQWFHDNGPAVRDLLKNVGAALKALAPAFGPASISELNVLSGFFGMIAKLPPGLAKPLGDVAGVLLTLNKLGVFSVGVKLTGVVTGMLAKTMLGRALLGDAGAAAGGLILPVTLTIAALTGLSMIKDKKGGGSLLAPKASDLGFNGSWAHDISHWFDVARHDVSAIWDRMTHSVLGQVDNLRHSISAKFDGIRHDIAAKIDSIRHDAAAKIDSIRHDVAAKIDSIRHDAASKFDSMRHDIASRFDSIRHDIASKWDSIWSSTVGRVQRGVGDVRDWFSRLPGMIKSALGDVGNLLWDAGAAIIRGLIGGIESMLGSLGSVAGSIGHFIANLKGPLPKDEVLLVPHGQAIIRGLMAGMGSQMPALRSQVGQVTAALLPGGAGSLAIGGGGGSGGGGAGGGGMTIGPINISVQGFVGNNQELVRALSLELQHVYLQQNRRNSTNGLSLSFGRA